MNSERLSAVERFLVKLRVVAKESRQLEWRRQRLFSERIDEGWVDSLADNFELAERFEAFVSRSGRQQDTVADKLLPRWRLASAERPGSKIEVLNRAA